MKEQIDNERKRNREFRDRQLAGDIVRIGLKNNYFGRVENGGFCSDGGINSTSPFFQNDNIDSIGYRYYLKNYTLNIITTFKHVGSQYSL